MLFLALRLEILCGIVELLDVIFFHQHLTGLLSQPVVPELDAPGESNCLELDAPGVERPLFQNLSDISLHTWGRLQLCSLVEALSDSPCRHFRRTFFTQSVLSNELASASR